VRQYFDDGVFQRVLAEVTRILEWEQRISYRGLKRRFALSDEDLEAIRDELIHAQQVAVDENDVVLVWQPRQQPVLPTGLYDTLPVSYTPKHLAKKILSARSHVEGENKHLSVLFCDVVGSMLLCERLGSERGHSLMREFFAVLSKPIHNLEGMINQFTGDGVIALFGAPIVAEDHAVRACAAALAIQKGVAEMNAHFKTEHGLPFEVRIGINSGWVVVGSIGDDLRMDYTAYGQVIGIAARLQAMAQPREVLISEFTQRELDGRCVTESTGQHDVRGVSAPLEAFRLSEVFEVSNRFLSSARHGLTRFVGRQKDLETLHAALAAAKQGQGQVIGIVAEAGAGKSRLCYEFLKGCRDSGFPVLVGHAVSHGRNIPYLPITQIFRSYFGIQSGEAPGEAREKIAQRLAPISQKHPDLLPLMNEFLGVADPEAGSSRIDPDARQRQLLDLLGDLVLGEVGDVDTDVTLIEDLHWLDSGSGYFVGRWVESIAQTGKLLLLTFRPEYRAAWMGLLHYRQLDLGPLTEAEVRELLAAVLREPVSGSGLVEAVSQCTGGNPFFCEELLQSMQESGELQMVEGRYRLLKPIDKLQTPPSVQAVLAARIDRLHERDKAVLQIAAVIGRDFSKNLLLRVTELPEELLDESLSALLESGFIYRWQQADTDEFRFRHALTQEVALHGQFRERRQQTHARVAECLASLSMGSPGEQVALIAHHHELGGQPLLAAQSYASAASYIRGKDRHQHQQFFGRVLALTADLPVTEARQRLRLNALVELIAGGAWRFTMSDAELDALCDEARALAQAAGLEELAMMIRAGRGAARGMMAGDIRRWGESIDAIMGEVSDTTSPEVAGALYGQSAYCWYIRGDMQRGLAHMHRAEALADGDVYFGQEMGFGVLVSALNMGSLMLAADGQLEAARAMNLRGQHLAAEAGLTEERIWLIANHAEILALYRLDHKNPELEDVAASAIEILEEAELVASDLTRGVAQRGLAVSLMMRGDYAHAVKAAENCLAHCRERRAHLEFEARCMALLAEAQLASGAVGAAHVTAQAAVARGMEQGARYFESLARVSLARAMLAQSSGADYADIRATLERAREVACRGSWPQVVELQALLAERREDLEAAERLRSEALEGYRAIGASGHIQRLLSMMAC
jgi:class 3 adenylate cyclase